ncbi:MAG TPA: hypothetical protein VF174_02850 [Micromonosporaceae bacterium]
MLVPAVGGQVGEEHLLDAFNDELMVAYSLGSTVRLTAGHLDQPSARYADAQPPLASRRAMPRIAVEPAPSPLIGGGWSRG